MARLTFWRREDAPRRGNPNTLSSASLTAAGLGGEALQSLTAAGFRVTHQDSDRLRRLIQPWQSRAFAYYDQIGEIKYASQFYSRMLSPLRLFPGKKDENGDYIETTDRPAVEALERIQDPGGGRESLLGSYGRLMFLVGETYLFCSRDQDTDLEQWEMLSTDELRIQSGIYTRYKAPSLAAEEYHEPSDDDWEPIDDDTAIAYRLWRRHPRFSMLADSTMQGVLDLCEELLLLTRAVRSRARSRLAGSGILAISEDFSVAPLEAVGDEDPQEDPFLADLTAAMMLPIANEGAASAVVPIVVRGPTEAVKDGIRHIPIVDPTQLYPETGLRRECIERIAIGLDMPPEILLGMSDANHWTVWMIDEQTWKAHGQPIANQLINDLNSAYFRPQLRAAGVTDWADYAIQYDAAAVVNHPDRSKDAKDLYRERAIGKAALRDAAGFDEDDAPTKDELAEMVGIATRDSSLAWFGTPAPRGGAVETAPGVIEDGTTDGGGSSTDGAEQGAEVEPGPPDSPTGEPVTVVGSANGNGHRNARLLRLASVISGAADLALMRAREAAGNRLRSLAKRDPELARLLDGIAARDVAATLGAERVHALGVSEPDLVSAATPLVRDALRLWGVTDEATISAITEQIERHAARTLYELRPVPLPVQFESYVAGVVALDAPHA